MPKLSTTVYKIENYELDVEKLIIEFSKRNEVVSSVNDANNVIVIITKTYQNIEWGKIREINDTIRNMYIFYMNTEQNLLFVNTTSKDIQERFIRVLKEDATKIY
ncbi:TPA: hypothetical protein DCZ39_04580 [Patescibacteria group bacterium]|nr:hypothetical protein [Candidatus Gracilibacteria bacterium]